VTPVVNGSQLIEYRQQQFMSTLEGSTADYLQVLDRDLMVGQMFTESQARSNARVVVIGPQVVTALFNATPRPRSARPSGSPAATSA